MNHKAVRERIFVTFINVLQNCDENNIKYINNCLQQNLQTFILLYEARAVRMLQFHL